jgi:hypothetical protein
MILNFIVLIVVVGFVIGINVRSSKATSKKN